MGTPAHPGEGPRPGFTLVALLVVIAILAILAALLPVFVRSRGVRRSVPQPDSYRILTDDLVRSAAAIR